ncbi:MAG: hypothetical protein ACI9VS_001570 [Candidatus Binatia bacterium]|jgi:hypothetical protein
MVWHYSDGGVKKGPVSDQEFQTLRDSDVIVSTTLVWREGMDEWQSILQLESGGDMPDFSANHASCSECGLSLLREDMLAIEGNRNRLVVVPSLHRFIPPHRRDE